MLKMVVWSFASREVDGRSGIGVGGGSRGFVGHSPTERRQLAGSSEQ